MKEETVTNLLDWMKEETEKNAKRCIKLIENTPPCILLIGEHEEGHGAGELSRQDPDETVSILPCSKNCLKEVNPEKHPGVYFGQPFIYEERWYGCWLCQREMRRKGANDEN